MIPDLTRRLIEYAARAATARASANATNEGLEKARQLDLARHWQGLADSYKALETADLCLASFSAGRLSSAKVSGFSGVLVVTCPITGRDYSTGILIETDAGLRARTSGRSHCPYCEIEHAWSAKTPPNGCLTRLPGFAEILSPGAWRQTLMPDCSGDWNPTAFHALTGITG